MIPLMLAVLSVPLVACATKPGRRFLAGHPLDGRRRTNATFFKAPTKALDGCSDRSWWHWRPGSHRGGIRVGSVAVAASLGYGLIAAPVATVAVLAAITAAGAGVACWKAYRGVRSWLRACTWNRKRPVYSTTAALALPVTHHIYYRRPAQAVVTAELGAPPARMRVPLDRRNVTIGLPPALIGDTARHRAALTAAATVLALEAPETSARLHGRRPQLACSPSLPPPPAPSWDDLAPAIAAQPRKALTFGLGKGGKLIQASYGDSPHLAVPGGSGGGKSNLIALLLLQELIRGTLVFILDPKGDSHLWAVGLPNVIYCVKPAQIHAALEWLGAERVRRGDTSYWSAVQNSGIDRARPGIRLVAVLEEMNIGTPGLKAHWAAIRDPKSDPKESPAFGGMREGACAGRSQDMHFWLAAQMLNVESTGVRDSTIRSQAGIKCMLRWDEPGWKMAVGKEVPMPPPVKTPGRSQIVTADGPRECQTPYLHLDDKDHPGVQEKAVRWARDLAVSRAVAAIPSGPAGVPRELWPPCVQDNSPIPLNAGQGQLGHGHVQDPPLTIREAMDAGIFGDRNWAAVVKAIQRAGIEPAGRCGTAYLYHPDDLRAAAEGKRGYPQRYDAQ